MNEELAQGIVLLCACIFLVAVIFWPTNPEDDGK